MTRVLVVESASPRRVRKKVTDILAGGIYEDPEVTILCHDEPGIIRFFSAIPQVLVIPLCKARRSSIFRQLSRERFDVLHVFWTGDKNYKRMKLCPLKIKARTTRVESGDGGVFRLTWKASIRHWQFRLAHPLPTDYWDYLPQSIPDGPEEMRCAPVEPAGTTKSGDGFHGPKVLLVQSAEPEYLLRALEALADRRILPGARYTLFCRNRPDVVNQFRIHPMIHEIRTHSETKNFWNHLLGLRSERFEAVVVFFTGDPSYWKIKYFAFMLGARHKLIFNEYNGCFFFNFRDWITLLSYRMLERSHVGGYPRWGLSTRVALFLLAKALLFPFRFLWLLLIWLRLRSAAMTRE